MEQKGTECSGFCSRTDNTITETIDRSIDLNFLCFGFSNQLNVIKFNHHKSRAVSCILIYVICIMTRNAMSYVFYILSHKISYALWPNRIDRRCQWILLPCVCHLKLECRLAADRANLIRRQTESNRNYQINKQTVCWKINQLLNE